MPLNDEESLIHYNQQLLLLDDENLTLKNQSLIIDYFFYREVLIEYMRSTIFPADCRFNQVWRSIHMAENTLSTQDIYKLVDSCPTDVNDLLVKIINYTITRCYKQNAYNLLIKTTKINSSDSKTVSRGISQLQLDKQSEKLVETLSKKSDNLTYNKIIVNNQKSPTSGSRGAFLAFIGILLGFFGICLVSYNIGNSQIASQNLHEDVPRSANSCTGSQQIEMERLVRELSENIELIDPYRITGGTWQSILTTYNNNRAQLPKSLFTDDYIMKAKKAKDLDAIGCFYHYIQ